MASRFDELVKAGKDTDALRLMAREMYDGGRIGHTRMTVAVRVADELDDRKGEVVTPGLKAKIAEQFEKSDKIIDEQSEFIEALRRRLGIAEKVCYAAHRYVKYGDSMVAVGWDALLDALQEWAEEKAAQTSEAQNDQT